MTYSSGSKGLNNGRDPYTVLILTLAAASGLAPQHTSGDSAAIRFTPSVSGKKQASNIEENQLSKTPKTNSRGMVS
jgi:hypothetical protein